MKFPIVQVLFLCVGFYAVNSSVNVAFHKPAWLSSTWYWKSKAENIVDGTKYTDDDAFFDRCVHTRYEQFPRWWVNLTGDYTIARIDIDYRRDTRYRMFGYKLIVSDTEDRRLWNSNHQIEGHICRDETRRNPPLQQTVPCLARGRFITYADNEGTVDPNPYVELCELEAYGCPTGWFGQDNCLEQCPDGCRDRVCNPDNGTCFAGCESGLQGDICDTACSHDSFGLGCQQSCFCDVDTCDPRNGTCPSDRCQQGWNGTACNQRCVDQTFGQNCEETCHCLQGPCDAANGTCLYDGCEPGWQTESCSKECDKGRFGHDCNLTCGACRHNAPCDHVTGKCPNGCSDGWTTSFCDEACPIGTFGINCTGECFCKNGTCDPTHGVCPGNACDRGWNGPSCSSQCDPGSYGYNCDQSCNCQTESCNRTTGLCPPGGCKDGWRTDTCSQKCDQGSYGTNCSGMCGSCMSNDTCHHINGHCSRGCTAGFKGELCDKECEDYLYGINCQHSCQGCQEGKCQKVHGDCLSGCISGMTGDLCNLKPVPVAQNMSTTIGAAAGGVLVIAAIVLIAVFIIHHRRRTSSVERSVEFHKTDTSEVCDIVSPNVQDLKEDKNTTKMSGDLITTNDKSIYSFINEEEGPKGENIYKNVDDGISVGSIASHLSTYLEETDDNMSEDMDHSENVYSNYVATVDTKINVSELTEVIAFKKESGAFKEEYAKFPRGLKHSHECGKGAVKKDKNRFKDMFPCEYEF
ncbi:multiple epidermal growth factor-like domains protein 10 isoform X1 [Mizuhopecten yessoensis]|uniref:multiple epidermal growth factor-like domains protein 10 isoform X1 n=1 Tax=Mizuhopecten yessoensis TaxID=6573 RepID=UPI000B45B95E|nr:multiple epidermal growth factor-like domains protein 10 isoform X1 [Mizuhopecten yessoensis]